MAGGMVSGEADGHSLSGLDHPTRRSFAAFGNLRNTMKLVITVTAVAIAVLLTLGIRACGPGGSGVLDHLTLSDGSEYLLTQKWNDLSEPYTVSFYFKPRGGAWGWCYIDHQDTRWHHAELRNNPEKNSGEVFRGGDLRAELIRDKQVFVLYRDNNQETREVPAPQERRKPEFPTKN